MDRPPFSRQQLGGYQFARAQSGDWVLALRTYYAALFAQFRPQIIAKSQTGWRDSHSGGSRKYAYFHDLTDQDIADIRAFISAYERLIIIALNTNIEPYFTDELDACLALDFNFAAASVDPDGAPSHERSRTEMGELEYQAKYQHSLEAIAMLAAELARAIPWMPHSDVTDPAARRCITYVPAEPAKQVHLPRDLARQLGPLLHVGFAAHGQSPILDCALTGSKASLKNARLAQKIAEWDRITSQRALTLSRSVEGYDVYVLDDLYQSGATMWSYARYLKSVGARRVYGLVCVKSLRDTDNA